MKRLIVVGLGLFLAPLAWSSGALEAHEDGALARSVVDTWASLFPEAEEPVEAERDLSGLAMVPREHQRGIGRVVTLDELDARVSDSVFERRMAQQAANLLMRERMKPFKSDGLADDVLAYQRTPGRSRLGRVYARPEPIRGATVLTTEGCGYVDSQGVFHDPRPQR